MKLRPRPATHALARDRQRAPADPDRIRDAIHPVNGDHRIRRLRGHGRADAAHRDADVGQCERWRIVDPVTDHDDGAAVGALARSAHDLDLLVGRALGEDLIDAHCLTDSLPDRGLVASDEYDFLHAGAPELFRQIACVITEVICHQHGARKSAVDANENSGPTGLGRVVQEPLSRVRSGVAALSQPCVAAHSHAMPADLPLDPLAGSLDHLLGKLEFKPTTFSPVNEGLGQDVR